jgi:hypothetical protein
VKRMCRRRIETPQLFVAVDSLRIGALDGFGNLR